MLNVEFLAILEVAAGAITVAALHYLRRGLTALLGNSFPLQRNQRCSWNVMYVCMYALKHRLFLTVFGKKRVWMTNQTNLCLERRRPIVFERVLTPPFQHSATWHPGPWEEQHPSDHTHITTTCKLNFDEIYHKGHTCCWLNCSPAIISLAK